MTGIVIVSHSRPLAASLADFVQHVAGADQTIPIAYAGGVSGKDEELGTDPTDIMEAIQSVFSSDGVVVLVDLGSSILSAELALDLLGDDYKKSVFISPAPLVEGAIISAVQSGTGATVGEVLEEAKAALIAKNQQLQESASESASAPNQRIEGESEKRVFTITLPNGLHARPAARIVRCAGEYNREAMISNLSNTRGPVMARSLNQISSLEVLQGHQILISASGENSTQFLDEIDKLVQDNFGESPLPVPQQTRKGSDGIMNLSPGIALGRAWLIQNCLPNVLETYIDDPAREIEIFCKAVNQTKENISGHARKLNQKTNSPEAEIFESHIILLEDPDLFDSSIELIQAQKWSSEYAWNQAALTVINRYKSLEDAYLQIRASDVKDVVAQVFHELAAIRGKPTAIGSPGFEGPYIIIAEELTPSQTISLNLDEVSGILTEKCGYTSHTAILSRALGIPAIGGYPELDSISNGDTLAIDAFSGEVYKNLDKQKKKDIIRKRKEWKEKQERLRRAAQKNAITVDNISFPILANIATPNEVEPSIRNGAEGIGLLRTEMLFLGRSEAPSVEEQIEYFSRIFQLAGEKPVTVRTFDIGGDKQIPYMNMQVEDNPFLGMRGIRLYESNPSMFENHIEALLRSALNYNVSVMFPMVAKIEEFLMARDIITNVHERLVNVKHKWPISMGVMIETPASVLIAEDLARTVDFFSIGTNDLTQYILAAERGSSQLAGFLDSLEPSVLRAVKKIADIGTSHNIPVSVCGELGSQIEAIPLLIGLGIDKISANSESIPLIKDTVRRTDYSQIREETAKLIHSCKSAEEIKMSIKLLI